jgi:AcrR family transcriptional regulator
MSARRAAAPAAAGTRIMRAKPSTPTSRGPAGHERRGQILDAANTYFRSYGYAKTTVADLAREIGLSPAYIYKFFDSKQAIGEAICAQTLGAVAAELREIAGRNRPAASRLRLVFQTVARRGAELCFTDRKLHDLAVTACAEKWAPIRDHQAALLEIIRGLLAEGRKSGEFERKTPIAETSLAILQTLELFSQPLLLEQSIDDPEGKAESVANLVLRSLAP